MSALTTQDIPEDLCAKKGVDDQMHIFLLINRRTPEIFLEISLPLFIHYYMDSTLLDCWYHRKVN